MNLSWTDVPLIFAALFACWAMVSRVRIVSLCLLFLVGLSVSVFLLFQGMEFLSLMNFFITIGFASVGYMFVTSLGRGAVRFDWAIATVVLALAVVTLLFLIRFGEVPIEFSKTEWIQGAHDLEELGKEMIHGSLVQMFLLVTFFISSLVGILCLARLEMRRKY